MSKISILSKAEKLLLFASNPHNITCQVKYLFLLSHMRSRSSVLAHVLGSNPDICGYGELHLPYTSRKSLINMRILLTRDLQVRLKDKYLLDKILHNYDFTSKIWKIAKPKAIFLLRKPESTLRSIINLGYISKETAYRDPQVALDYYCSRLKNLEQYAQFVRGNYFFIESDDLVEDADRVLKNLSTWLDLDQPLNKNYSLFENTGTVGYGDPSSNIKSGTIKSTKSHLDITINTEILQIAEDAYQKCYSTLSKYRGLS